MLKVILILLAGIVAVSNGDCVSCADSIAAGLEVAQSVINGLQPIEVEDVSICTKLVVTNIAGLTPAGEACLITSPSSPISTQRLEVKVATVHIECHFDDIFSGMSNNTVQIFVVDAENINLFFITDNDFDEGTSNITTIEIDQGLFNSTQFSLKGNSSTVEIAQMFITNSITSNAIGYGLRFIASLLVDMVKDNPTLVEIISLLHCPEPDSER